VAPAAERSQAARMRVKSLGSAFPSDEQERPHQIAHHVVQKSVATDRID